MDSEVADEYYGECISASGRIMDEGPFSLYKPSPASPEEAAENYRSMFDDPNVALNEVILIEGYNQVGHGHGWNNWAQPAQTAGTWPHPGRMNASLDLVDTYPTYSNPDESSPIVTTVDGNYNNYEGYDPDREYLTFDSPANIFEDKDARLFGSVILPFTTWKDTKIIIQGGYIKHDGTAVIEASDQTTVNGKTYCTYGACTEGQYSGFSVSPNTTRTGFLIKKTLDKEFVPTTSLTRATNDWIAIRYAEILLNYAEAVVESGQGSATKAAEALNDIRQRAGHQNEISLTLENVLRERRIELVYENKRYWDLCRRREFHTKFDNYQKKALVPVLDLRNMKYIFIRKYAVKSVPLNYMSRGYYSPIPGISSNKVTQNPQY
jgi:starch-binding outer membrane protein, SusD/RagB family